MAGGPLSPNERNAYELGCRSFERGEIDAALTWFRHLLATRGDFADVHYRVGLLLERRDELADAAQSLRRALRINPRYAEAMLALGSVYERLGDFDRSREVAGRAGQLARESGEAAVDATTRGKLANLQAALGDAYRQAGELRDAIEAYRKALDRCPNFHDIRTKLALALREAGMPQQALSELDRVLRAHPDYHEAAVQRGLSLYSLGRSDEALAEWSRVLDRDPSNRDARMYLRLVQPRAREQGSAGIAAASEAAAGPGPEQALRVDAELVDFEIGESN
jgi:tetratricopeptide (TPR) repeat protein